MAEDRLDVVLRRWHEATRTVEAAACAVTRTEKNEVFNKTVVFHGTFKYLKPHCWDLDLHKKDAPQEFEKFVSVENAIYQHVPSVKAVKKFELPPAQFVRDRTDASTSLYFGMTPAAAKTRFDWKLVKEDQNYIYLAIEPRRKEDRADFQHARLVLFKDRFLPRQVWFQQSSGIETTWDIAKLDTAVKLTKDDFVPKIPDGWRLLRIPEPDGAKPRDEAPRP